MPRIVLIEDDLEIRQLVTRALAEAGYDIEAADRALEGLELAVKGDPDLVILDLGLPDIDGTELLRMIRAVSEVPVIIITARGADEVVARTLDAGADDYLVKPFSMVQLMARLRAVLRRGAPLSVADVIEVAELQLDIAARTVVLGRSEGGSEPKGIRSASCPCRAGRTGGDQT